MSIKSFKFVSPGVFINEIDNSFIPKTADVIGPVVIGRSAYGQALRPTKVDSFSEFIENFGYPIAGGRGADVSRNGNNIGPTYGPFHRNFGSSMVFKRRTFFVPVWNIKRIRPRRHKTGWRRPTIERL